MWIIERYHNSAPVFFADAVGGKPEWSTQFGNAIRFYDRDSASRILAHFCDGNGRVVEHEMMKAPLPAGTPDTPETRQKMQEFIGAVSSAGQMSACQ